MNGTYLNETESRITATALQLLERDIAEKLEQAVSPYDAVAESPVNIHSLLDQHDALSALAVMLSTLGKHWVNRHGIELATEALQRYVDLLATSISTDRVPHEEEHLIDHDLRLRQIELANSSNLLSRLRSN